MTTEHEALRGVKWEGRMTRAAYDYEAPYPKRDSPARRHGFAEGAHWAMAQVDEDIRRLVGASQVAIAAVVRSTEYDTVPHEAELSLALHNLRAALEPFKATTVEEGRSDA